MPVKNKVLSLGLATAIAATLFSGAASATASPGTNLTANTVATQSTSISSADFVANLPASERAKWNALSADQQRQALNILSGAAIDTITTDAEAKAVSPHLAMATSSFTTTAAKSGEIAATNALATVRRSAWTEGWWTIFGVRYAEIRTTVDYNTSAGRVVSHNACYNNYTNYVPFRSIQTGSYTIYGNGKLTCETSLSLARPGQATTYGYQGIRVNGYGTIEATWNP